MDAPPADPPAAAHAPAPYAAIDYGPRGAEEARLCRDASHFDWAYFGGMVVATAGAVVLDDLGLQSSSQTGIRLLGPGLVGLTWGWTVGGFYLTLPQCSPDFAGSPPIEGDLRSQWPLALSFSLLAAATAPILVGLETGGGTQTLAWSETERAMRLVVASATGVVGSMLPYVLPPSTWRSMQKLQHLRAGVAPHAATVSYTMSF